jgi:hypothetical protein
VACNVVYALGIDVLVGKMDREPWALCSAFDLLAYAVTALLRERVFLLEFHICDSTGN